MDVNNEYGCLEMQKALLSLIKKFDSFCLDSGIQYSLAGGSLLGAVRHKGFIPWDDDLDIYMDRPNFERLRHVINTNAHDLSFAESDLSALWIPRVRLSHTDYNDKYQPTLDIFIMDLVPNNKFLAKLKYFGALGCQGMIKNKLTLNKGNLFLKLCSIVTFLIGRCFTTKFKFKMYDKMSQLWGSDDSEKVCWYNCLWQYIHFTFNREIIEQYIRAPFEDTELPITAAYDHCLSVEYGDYMKMPKVEHRVAKHLNDAAEIADLYMNKK